MTDGKIFRTYDRAVKGCKLFPGLAVGVTFFDRGMLRPIHVARSYTYTPLFAGIVAEVKDNEYIVQVYGTYTYEVAA